MRELRVTVRFTGDLESLIFDFNRMLFDQGEHTYKAGRPYGFTTEHGLFGKLVNTLLDHWSVEQPPNSTGIVELEFPSPFRMIIRRSTAVLWADILERLFNVLKDEDHHATLEGLCTSARTIDGRAVAYRGDAADFCRQIVDGANPTHLHPR